VIASFSSGVINVIHGSHLLLVFSYAAEIDHEEENRNDELYSSHHIFWQEQHSKAAFNFSKKRAGETAWNLNSAAIPIEPPCPYRLHHQ
jgi:cytochrome b subunit of formate dehydrogenase